MVTRLTSTLPNPAAEVIAIRIALNLTDEQVTRLERTSDSLKLLTKGVADRAQKELAKAGPNPDPGRCSRRCGRSSNRFGPTALGP